jgi:hypothetical protein
MGFFFVFAPCIGCGIPFGFNPERVPSIRVDNVRRPVCRTCFERRQAHRRANGLVEETFLPGAYDPVPELPHDGSEW